jgi:hypothetical protein
MIAENAPRRTDPEGTSVRIAETQIHVHFEERAYDPSFMQARLDTKVGGCSPRRSVRAFGSPMLGRTDRTKECESISRR